MAAIVIIIFYNFYCYLTLLLLLFWYCAIAADWFDLENAGIRASKAYNQMMKLLLIGLQ